MTSPFARCVVHDVGYIIDDGYESMPSPPSRVDVDLPIDVVMALRKNPDDAEAVATATACLTFTIGLMGYSYCTIAHIGRVDPT